MYYVPCRMYRTLYRTLYTVLYTVCSVHSAQYTVCTVHSVLYTVYTVHSIQYSVHCTVQCTVHSAWYIVHFVSDEICVCVQHPGGEFVLMTVAGECYLQFLPYQFNSSNCCFTCWFSSVLNVQSVIEFYSTPSVPVSPGMDGQLTIIVCRVWACPMKVLTAEDKVSKSFI